MQVIFRTNLGLADAKKHGLEPQDCTTGNTVDVKEDVAEALKAAGLAVSAEDAKKDELIQSALGVSKKDFEASLQKGVAKKPAITAPAK